MSVGKALATEYAIRLHLHEIIKNLKTGSLYYTPVPQAIAVSTYADFFVPPRDQSCLDPCNAHTVKYKGAYCF